MATNQQLYGTVLASILRQRAAETQQQQQQLSEQLRFGQQQATQQGAQNRAVAQDYTRGTIAADQRAYEMEERERMMMEQAEAQRQQELKQGEVEFARQIAVDELRHGRGQETAQLEDMLARERYAEGPGRVAMFKARTDRQKMRSGMPGIKDPSMRDLSLTMKETYGGADMARKQLAATDIQIAKLSEMGMDPPESLVQVRAQQAAEVERQEALAAHELEQLGLGRMLPETGEGGSRLAGPPTSMAPVEQTAMPAEVAETPEDKRLMEMALEEHYSTLPKATPDQRREMELLLQRVGGFGPGGG